MLNEKDEKEVLEKYVTKHKNLPLYKQRLISEILGYLECVYGKDFVAVKHFKNLAGSYVPRLSYLLTIKHLYSYGWLILYIIEKTL